MDAILSVSILAAFLSGMAALFAPCCVSVLLPTYAAAVFRERKRVLFLTFVYGAGVAAVLLPIGLGAAALAQIFRSFHRELYLAGGVLMLAFAFLSIRGTSMGVPFLKMPSGPRNGSVFLLGVFSGAATSCCAPVLAGAMTLAVISGAFWKSLLVVFSYIFGMIFPLALAGYFYDRFRIDRHPLVRGKIVSLLGKRVHTTNLAAAAMFLLIGLLLIVLALSDNAFFAPEYQTAFGGALVALSERMLAALSFVPDVVWGVGILALFAAFLRQALSRREQE